jgi:hypothetical protein
MRDVDFVETSFAGRTDFIVVRYSSSYNGLPSNNRFRFQGNVVELNSIQESIYIAFTDIFLIVSVGRGRVIWHWSFRVAYYLMIAEYGALQEYNWQG